MKRVALVTSHFPPSNLVGVHRARIWAQFLPEYGWKPTVITAHWKHYQEPLDWNLLSLVSDDTEVVRTNALDLRYAKILGNMALRAMWWTRKALRRLAESGQLDFMHIIVPDHYSALLGPMLHKSHRIAYGIDYMDPWVHASPSEKRFLSKAWLSCVLSYHLEPWSIRSARLITGVSASSYESVLKRNAPHTDGVVTAEIPMANASSDYRALSGGFKPDVTLFDPSDGRIHFVYAGTIPSAFFESLQCFLASLSECVDENIFRDTVRVWLIGTGTNADTSRTSRVEKEIERFSLAEHVSEHPPRIGYLDTLWHLKAASALLILGSTEIHYTPSKVYQATQSGKPVIAFVSERSGAAEILRSSGRGYVVNFPDERRTVVRSAKCALTAIAAARRGTTALHFDDSRTCAARAGARRLAESLDKACLG